MNLFVQFLTSTHELYHYKIRDPVIDVLIFDVILKFIDFYLQ